MKAYLSVLIFAFIFSINAYGQHDTADVVYMKSGAVFIGKVTVQVAGESYRIERTGGSLLIVAACDVKKIKKGNATIPKYVYPPSCKQPFPYRNTGPFFQAQIPLGFNIGGIKAIAGYQFHRFAQIGVTAGVVFATSISKSGRNLGAGYAPICFYYAGDILPKEFTPFYSLEFGYAYSARPNREFEELQMDYEYQHHTGGYTGGLGFGCKYHAWNSIFSCSWSVNFDFINASLHDWGSSYTHGTGGSTYDYNYSGTMYMIGTRFSIGF